MAINVRAPIIFATIDNETVVVTFVPSEREATDGPLSLYSTVRYATLTGVVV